MSRPCHDCIAGAVHPGIPTGSISIIHELSTYIASPPAPNEARAIIVIVPDVFGWDFQNTRLLADEYATKGNFLVYVPNFTEGDHVKDKALVPLDKMNKSNPSILTRMVSGLKLGVYFMPFLFRNRGSVARPRIWSYFRALRESATLPIGVAGFCWGGMHAIQLTHAQPVAAATPQLVYAAFAAHPVPISVPADIDPVSAPLSFAVGTKDMALSTKSVGQVQQILNAKSSPNMTHEVAIYEGARHGFAIRSNPGDEGERQAQARAVDQAVAWFTRWLPAQPVVPAQPTVPAQPVAPNQPVPPPAPTADDLYEA